MMYSIFIFSRIHSVFLSTVLAIVLLSASVTMTVVAADNSSSSTIGTTRYIKVCTPGFKSGDKEYSAPKGSILYVTGGTTPNNVQVHFTKVGEGSSCQGLTFNNPVQIGVQYEISNAVLLQYASISSQLDYGMLIVPFKFHPSDQSVTGAATIGGYLGYKFSFFEITDITPFATSGLGAVETTKQQNGQSTTSTAPSFSVGGGVILVSRIAGTPIHAGFAVGVDWAGKGNDYKYEGKPWIAISIGTNFSSSP
jgi:hypothetical protein